MSLHRLAWRVLISQVEPAEMVRLVIFDPPGAATKLREWLDERASIFADIPEDSIRIEIGRAVGGDFAAVSVDEAYADRFANRP